MSTIRLTMAQALTRYLAAQRTEIGAERVPLLAGVWAIFGHGNVAGLGEALWHVRDRLPTYRGHNEQSMAHAAIAYAKASNRRRMMAVTTSIGPGATNVVTAAAVAHVNRLPVLILPGDVFANRVPDPVLQQVESFADGTVSANDCFRPVSRFYDRITRPEQILTALPRAMTVLTDPAECGPVTLSICQDVQSEAFDYPESFFAERVWSARRLRPDVQEAQAAAAALAASEKPLIVAGGGVHYAGACDALAAFAERHAIPVAETQAGKSALPWDHPRNLGAVGVTGTSAANELAREADVVLAVGTRLQDFTTGSWSLFANPTRRIIQLNVCSFDAGKHHALALVADAREGLAELDARLGDWQSGAAWETRAGEAWEEWAELDARATGPSNEPAPPTDAQVIGATMRAVDDDAVLVCAAGGLPGELHRHWRAARPNGYHLEYGYSCMGYEIAGGIGVKMAHPDREVVVMVGDGSYLMLNSELATSVMLGQKLVVVLLDNRGFGCINRLQRATGGERFNNLFAYSEHVTLPDIDFVAHARALGAGAEKVDSLAGLEPAIERALESDRSYVVVIDTDPDGASVGGSWWDVKVPEVSERAEVVAAAESYAEATAAQRLGD